MSAAESTWTLERFLAHRKRTSLELLEVPMKLRPIVTSWRETHGVPDDYMGATGPDKLTEFRLAIPPPDHAMLARRFSHTWFRIDGWMRNSFDSDHERLARYPWIHCYFVQCRVDDDQIQSVAKHEPDIIRDDDGNEFEIPLGGFHYTAKGPW